MKNIIFIADRHREYPFDDDSYTVSWSELTEATQTWLINCLGDPSISEDDSFVYHVINFDTVDQIKEMAEKYLSTVKEELWHIYEGDDKPFHDGGDDFDYDIASLEILTQFAFILEDSSLLRELLKDLDTERNGHKHPYAYREDDEESDYNVIFDALEYDINRLSMGVHMTSHDCYDMMLTPKEVKSVANFEEASTLCQKYIAKHRISSRNWSGGQVFNSKGLCVAQIHYNGRIEGLRSKSIS